MAKAKAKKASGKKKIGAVEFSIKECGMTRTMADTAAKIIRQKGKMARVITNSEGKGFCVYEGPTSSTIVARNKAKAKSAKVTGTKKAKPKAKAKKK